MRLPLRPIVSALRRRPLMPWLVAVQVAVAVAILANAVFLLQRQVTPLLADDGIARDRLLLVDQMVARQGSWTAAQIDAVTALIDGIPGVEAAAPALGLPMKQSMTFTLSLRGPGGQSVVASGFAGEGLREALGLDLVQGRDFELGEGFRVDLASGGVDVPAGTPVILTEALARLWFPDGDALGGRLEQTDGGRHLVVVGVVRRLLRYQLDELDDGRAQYSILLPAQIVSVPVLNYAVRVDPQRRDAVADALPGMLENEYGALMLAGVPVRVDSYEALRDAAFRSRRAAAWLFGTVIAVILAVTGIGIGGLSAYWVETRLRLIGIRRALGASRADIIGHCLAENAVVVGMGLVPGLVAAYAINQWLMQAHAMARLPLAYLPLAALLLWLLGLYAASGPARRAARVPPAIATRSA